jgi:hypothetical protein
LPQRTLGIAVVAPDDPDRSASLCSEHIVFRSPLPQSPPPGQAATLPVLIRPIKALQALGYEIGNLIGRN